MSSEGDHEMKSAWRAPEVLVLRSGAESNPNSGTGPKQAQNPEGVGSTGSPQNAFPGQEEEEENPDIDIVGGS